ncbi:MAG: PIG-L family deacetylase [Deltaproteobacteria bacterium]|nr:PIG-L family deacetylase [Deltaproteobacteria bacterium]
MLTEDALIPFHSTDPTGRKVLVLAPHPDDETFGCGGTLALHATAGDPVKVVFLTNGDQGDSSGKYEKDEYITLRQNEAKEACTRLGIIDLEFWPYGDRSLAGSRGALRRMIDLLEDFRPRIVYAPSPLEFHPDHRAACFLLCDALHSYTPDLDVAFCEIGQPVRVNRLVDITGVSQQKRRAIDAYVSQLRERPYGEISLALDRYRSLTLGEDVTYAEGFSVWGADIIRKIGPYGIPLQQAARLLPGPGEGGPLVSVIVRTKDRPVLLANALKSIAEQTYANLEIVVVNDGGEDVRDVVNTVAGGIPAHYIAHETCKGRAAAANAGLYAAKGLYLNFLDDDDLLYPDHIETLVRRLQSDREHIAYTSVLSAYFNGPPEYPENCARRVVDHDIDFDPERLLFQNYIPIMSVLFHRDVLQKVEGFDHRLDLFEDWDFWIRASRHFRFHHIDKITAEYRFYDSETTDAAHHKKYAFAQAQAEIFDRVTPFLTGKIWTNLLNSDFLDELRRGRKGVKLNSRYEHGETLLNDDEKRLQRAETLITELRRKDEENQRRLQEILSSRGWLWLDRFRRMKRKLTGGV